MLATAGAYARQIAVKSVLVIGGYGGFGARLSRRLAEDGWRVIIAGRNLAKAEALAATITSGVPTIFDREGDVEAALASLSPMLLIDAAGPFQNSDYRVAQACIAQGIHYLDLADARAFVTGIAELNSITEKAGVAVISGASSVPALSGAVLRELTEGLSEVTRVDMAISASDKSTAGTSVASAILSYVGQPLAIWQGRRWRKTYGWQNVRRASVCDQHGKRTSRLLSSADVPDLDIVPQALKGHPATSFNAGSEFGFQVWTLWFLSWPVRWGLLKSLTAMRRVLLPLQSLTRPFSSGTSFMTVDVHGLTPDRFEKRRWELIATEGRGPEIPVMAAQLLARTVSKGTLKSGARHAAEELSLNDFAPHFEELEIETNTTRTAYEPLYKRVMGASFYRLPKPVRTMHEVCGDGGAVGIATVTRGPNPLAQLVAAIMRFPKAGEHDLHVSFREDDGRETWERDFAGATFRSELSEKDGKLVERFGPLRFQFELPSDACGLKMMMVGWSAFGISLPLFLAPKTVATETAEDGVFVFDVAIALPLIGDIVHYRGSLKPCSSAQI